MKRTILVLSPNLSSNGVGRTFCIWSLCRHLGWPVRVIGQVREAGIWEPMKGSDFETDCEGATASDMARVASSLARTADVVIAIKPLPETFGVGLNVARASGRPLVLDIDDPELEFRFAKYHLRHRLGVVSPRMLRSPYHPWRLKALQRKTRTVVRMVSNPQLAKVYGGFVIPHVRSDPGAGAPHSSTDPVIGFVGTIKPHKGVEILRRAVAAIQPCGSRLILAGNGVPQKALGPWEDLRGACSLEEAMTLTKACDIIAVPSLPEDFGNEQLPVKLIDAMITGRAIVASRLAPIEWALEGTGMLTEPGDVEELSHALLALSDPTRRADLGRRARVVATRRFTPGAVAPTFADAIESALSPANPELGDRAGNSLRNR